ncbi:acyl-dehydrogenase domain containing protein [Niveomyces insectorum RCEF 264]|uniref:Acyl-dehydrogenase domain containing protein n=1 Tax=Niveomyces insectorum RCEF 264 TaxID=1081102 RepID=A0A167RYX6_9HYPO|nr:acyl-dehydrogenase domain containing protein [Niveomyces insectorum RCEF 264]
MEPSTSNTGFFQQLPELKNQFYDDVCIQRAFKFLVPPEVRQQVESELAQLGADVLAPQIFDYITDAERNLPYLRGSGRDAFGHPTSELVTGEGWRKLQAFGIERGLVAYNYTTNYGASSRLLHMLRFVLWEPSGASTTCPGAMTDGAARLLQRHLARSDLDPSARHVLASAYARLTSRDPARAWTSGQWMTERPGGSDVSRTETVATFVGRTDDVDVDVDVDADGLPLGPWSIDGFKWFSSATDANMTILLAQTSHGLSAFYAPMRRRRRQHPTQSAYGDGTELNGIRIQRLKDKLGTRPVPTAELELRGVRAWLLGAEGHGVREIATVLAITRVHCAVACLGLAGRALGVAKAYARVRTIAGGRRFLYQSPLHMHTLAGLVTDYHGMLLLTLYTAHPPPHLVAPLLRVLSSLHKAYCCQQAVPLLHAACLESLGGVGYLLNHETEPLNLARLFRDGCVNAIWEGTTDVLSTDLVRTLTHAAHGRASLDALQWLVGAATARDALGSHIVAKWTALRARIETGIRDAAARDVLLADARAVLYGAAEILIASLLLADARSDGAPAAAAMSRRFLVNKGFLASDPAAAAASADERLATDTAIVYGPRGVDAGTTSAAKL